MSLKYFERIKEYNVIFYTYLREVTATNKATLMEGQYTEAHCRGLDGNQYSVSGKVITE